MKYKKKLAFTPYIFVSLFIVEKPISSDFMQISFLLKIQKYFCLLLSVSYIGFILFNVFFFYTQIQHGVCRMRPDSVLISIEPRRTTILCAKFSPPQAYIGIVVSCTHSYTHVHIKNKLQVKIEAQN